MARKPSLRLILASGSAARRELLEKAGLHFDILPANIDEPTGEGIRDIRSFVHHVAWSKAAAVAPQIDDGIIIAADTVGWLNSEVIGKPSDEADARRILRLLGGTRHELWTGVCLWRRPDDLQLCWHELSLVEMAKMSEEEIDAYLATRTWRGCSGSYAIQEGNDPYVRVLQGSVSNVIGLPMETLTRALSCLQEH